MTTREGTPRLTRVAAGDHRSAYVAIDVDGGSWAVADSILNAAEHRGRGGFSLARRW